MAGFCSLIATGLFRQLMSQFAQPIHDRTCEPDRLRLSPLLEQVGNMICVLLHVIDEAR